MRCVISGGLGFIGTELTKQLSLRDDVEKIDIIDIKTDVVREPKVYSTCNDLIIGNNGMIQEIFNNADIVYGLAAELGGIKYFHQYPANILSHNNMITDNTLSYIVKSPKKPLFVYISSSMVYEAAQHFPTSESDTDIIPKPLSAYGFSKLCGEEYCKAYNEEYGLRYTIVRPFNSVCANEYPKEIGMAHVIPDVIKKIHEGQGTKQNPLELFGNGEQVRCFTHVEDVCRGIILASFNKNAIGEAFNISHPESWRIKDLAKLIYFKMTNEDQLYTKNIEPFKYDVQKRLPDVTKAREILGFEAKYSVRDKIDEVIEWVRGVL